MMYQCMIVNNRQYGTFVTVSWIISLHLIVCLTIETHINQSYDDNFKLKIMFTVHLYTYILINCYV